MVYKINYSMKNKILLIVFLVLNILIVPVVWMKLLDKNVSSILGVLLILIGVTALSLIIKNYDMIKKMWTNNQ